MARTKKDTPLRSLPRDLILPSAIEIEASVLGAMMIEKDAVPKAIELLDPSAFYSPKNRIVFEAMQSLFESNEPIDTVTLYEELRKSGKIESVGGAVYLSQLAQDISSAANVTYHAKIILEKAILRNLITATHEVAQEAYQSSEDAFDILDFAQRKIFEITEQYMKSSYQDMDRAVRSALEYIEAIHSSDYKQFSVPTGFYDLDEILGGFQKSDLIILAARPSMGKTAFALSLTRNAAMQFRIPVAFFSLEMATIQLVIRLICAEGRLDAHKVRTGKLPGEDGMKLGKIASKLIEAPIYVDDAPAQTILEIRAKARRLKAEKNIGLIVLDYLQLIQGPARSESREREISQISRSLKALAKELNIPILALAQLNRAVEARTDKRPQLSDLRESGSIEQDADVVMFLNRPEYYGITTDNNGNSTQGMAEVIIAKQRNGPVGDIQLSFIKEYARFESREHFRQIETNQITPVQQEEDFPI
ncbi:MAG: replicative DNA helicase [Ignavibacteria bacterium]|nr:replicative DNA helicase [Ignavibacteria bacterium]